ncbi:hypothetical protein SmJEL517_g00818 [Synchytrium microbalum]|uniref:Delta(24(24(1)))-sterol reductase n=1 Tax=Synchytrium microbalum TaxID=1806994 RepID=A0A507C819_9FUNG|nr:uncharacterized protein SmJEL517_g00818 [Synchytrium microbalum]TPX37197.1 hypothetical protein SmJEL517_g00818 [Synchytrium microbalum]
MVSTPVKSSTDGLKTRSSARKKTTSSTSATELASHLADEYSATSTPTRRSARLNPSSKIFTPNGHSPAATDKHEVESSNDMSGSNNHVSDAVLTNRKKDSAFDQKIIVEFGGTPGVIGIMLGFTALMYYFWICLEYYNGAMAHPSSLDDIVPFLQRMGHHVVKGAPPTVFSVSVYVGYILFSAFLSMTMPGPIVKGLPVPSLGYKQLDYLCNGVSSFYVTLVTSAVLHYYRILPLGSIIDNIGSIMTVAIISGWTASLLIYISAFVTKTTHRMSGNPFYDFFMGAVLNPRIGNLDLKMWAEIRVPWIILFYVSVSAAVKHYEETGVVGPNLWFMVLAHFLYVNACMKGEECIPTTWDIFYEKFGFMLCFWNLAGVPFSYCYSTMYLLKTTPGQNLSWSTPYLIFVYTLLVSGYYMWDTANSQKNRFRMQIAGTYIPRWTFPQLPWGTLVNPTYIKTKHGSLLLTSGWYGIARKIHYTADLMMALSWGLITGFGSFLPYFYVCFFTTVLVHRVTRDMERCAKKYGQDWEDYTTLVPWIFIPGIF